MIRTDEDALICDFAEYYHIYDYKALPVAYAATLAVGLRGESRIMLKLSGMERDVNTQLMGMAVDYLALLWWAQTKAAQKNQNKPTSVFTTTKAKERDKPQSYSSAEAFEKARKEALNGGD